MFYPNEAPYWEIDAEGFLRSLPAWMFDADYCGRMTWGVDPVCSLTSLFEVQSLLRSAGL